MDSQIKALHVFLQSQPSGPLSVDDLCSVLQPAWLELSAGTDRHSTYANKLERIEIPEWNRQTEILTFRLERHGGTVNGSSRAELHYWQVSFTPPVATVIKEGYRQLEPMAHRVDTKKLAEKIAQAIVAREEDPFLLWSGDVVEVLIGELIPQSSASAQTVTSRRQKFRSHLEALMEGRGWTEVKARYNRPAWKEPVVG